ncbi:flagellar basal body rod protein FlgC [Tuberibacillus sp. Marseille-P3662]|uniref:flagellar basal body rod protein FlgC n=1 Tax=Tuberibacillus sp. Marseille-P3662 TaxID=1965358 RepID=UPI000A1CD25E|nr:flagellar basal body rod protein FlgC [Tuberibacillus sp. Marseille-P3662]
MGVFTGVNISGSALTTQRLRMDVTSANMANANTTRAEKIDGEWQPYRRKMVTTSPIKMSFSEHLNDAKHSTSSGGVQVNGVVQDETPFKMVYQPDHPDANDDGYVQMPNVDPLKEMVDLVSASRSYEANVTVLNANKNQLINALKIGK